jgi:ABC-2 type transport system permease protein
VTVTATLSTATLRPTPTATGPAPRSWLGSRVHDVVVLTRRNLLHILREPLQLSDVTVQPVLFTLLFVYVFGSGVPIHGGNYKDFAIAGLMLLNLTTSSMGTAVGLISDLTTGAIDRFRTLPMWRSAVLVGRSVADLLSAAICLGIVALTGLAIGWRPSASPASIAAGFGVALLFSYALSWACACLGIVSKGPESAQGVGLIILFPLAIVSNAMVPTSGMPGLAAGDRQLEPRQLCDRGSEAPLRKPKPVELASRLADAAPGLRGAGVVACDTDRLRPFGRAPVPAKDDRVTSFEHCRKVAYVGQNRPLSELCLVAWRTDTISLIARGSGDQSSRLSGRCSDYVGQDIRSRQVAAPQRAALYPSAPG